MISGALAPAAICLRPYFGIGVDNEICLLSEVHGVVFVVEKLLHDVHVPLNCVVKRIITRIKKSHTRNFLGALIFKVDRVHAHTTAGNFILSDWILVFFDVLRPIVDVTDVSHL